MAEKQVEEVVEHEPAIPTAIPLAIGTLYPTESMRALIQKFRQIRMVGDQTQIDTFRRESCLFTELTSMPLLLTVVLLFKKHIPIFSNKEVYDSSAKHEVEQLCETNATESRNITLFYMCLMEHFMKRNYALMVFTRGGTAFEVIDLLETPETARYVTISECNYCRKEATTKPLDLCVVCKKAAYCSNECQSSDWRAFHKHYCAYLVERKPETQ